MDPLYAGSSIRTYTGNYVDVFNPDPETLEIVDVAHALSMQCRYGGHMRTFYSVAQHSIWVCEYLEKCGYPKEMCFEGLMHDASEAYLVDIPKPIKVHLKDYNDVEDTLMAALSSVFGFTYPLSSQVKIVDRIALEWEWAHLVCEDVEIEGDFEILTHEEAETKFLALYERLKP